MPDPQDTELHELFDGRLKIRQHRDGYRFSVDSILLADYAAGRALGAVADLGTGCGVLPVILAGQTKISRITGVEIQRDLAALARANLQLNGIDHRADICCADIKRLRKMLPAGAFDTVVTNPPFYAQGSGRTNPDHRSAVARHELHGSLMDFTDAAAFLLRQGGKFITVHLAARIADLMTHMRTCRLEPKTLQFIHSRADRPAALVLIEGVKGAGAEAGVLPPLILYGPNGRYTEQALAVFERI